MYFRSSDGRVVRQDQDDVRALGLLVVRLGRLLALGRRQAAREQANEQEEQGRPARLRENSSGSPLAWNHSLTNRAASGAANVSSERLVFIPCGGDARAPCAPGPGKPKNSVIHSGDVRVHLREASAVAARVVRAGGVACSLT